MNNKYILSGALALSLMTASCDLDYSPVSDYSDLTEGIENQEEEVIYANRSDAESALLGLYNDFKGNQNFWQLDHLLIGDVHSDNAYAGTTRHKRP